MIVDKKDKWEKQVELLKSLPTKTIADMENSKLRCSYLSEFSILGKLTHNFCHVQFLYPSFIDFY